MTHSISPELAVRGGIAAVSFYQAAFGARQLYRVGGTDDMPDLVALLEIGQSRFWVSDESPEHGNFAPQTLGGCTIKLLLQVEDPALVQAHAISLGANEISPVAESHGWLVGRIADPFGHHWEIGKPLIPWPPAA